MTGPVASTRSAWTPAAFLPRSTPDRSTSLTEAGASAISSRPDGANSLSSLTSSSVTRTSLSPGLASVRVRSAAVGPHPGDVRRRGGRGLRRQPLADRRGRARRGRPGRPRSRRAGRARPARAARGRRGSGRPRPRSKDAVPLPGTRTPRRAGTSTSALPSHTVTSATAGPLSGLTRVSVEECSADAPTPVNQRSGHGSVAVDGGPGAGAGHDEAGGEVAAAVDDDGLALGEGADAGVDRGGVVVAPDAQREVAASRARCSRGGGRRRPGSRAGQTAVARSSAALVGA